MLLPLLRGLLLVLGTVVVGLTASEAPAPTGAAGDDAAANAAPGVAYIHVEGAIDPIMARYFQRSLEQAIAAGVDTIVTHIDSPGGRLDSLLEMVDPLLAIGDSPRLIAYVDSEAISAAAALAYGHHEIHLENQAKIGDIGVIFQKADGTIEYAPEKIETFMRAQLRSLAQVRGWSEPLLSKMTARNQILYEVHHPDGQTEFVLGDDLEPFLKRHPEIDREDDVIEYMGEDRLLTLTASEAVDLGMATALTPSLEALYGELGTTAGEVLDLSPTTTERIAWALASWAPLLLSLAVLFVILELKTPGVGIWATLAGLSGFAFFICQFYLDLASHIEVVLVVIGLILVVVDIVTAIGGGMLILGGATLVMVGFVLAFMPDSYQFAPGDQRWGDAISGALLQSMIAIAVAAVGVLVGVAALPNSRLMRRIGVEGSISGTSDDGGQIATGIIGKRGRTSSGMHPGGTVVIDGEDFSARAEAGAHLAPGTPIEVVKREFGELVVRPLAEESDREAAG